MAFPFAVLKIDSVNLQSGGSTAQEFHQPHIQPVNELPPVVIQPLLKNQVLVGGQQLAALYVDAPDGFAAVFFLDLYRFAVGFEKHIDFLRKEGLIATQEATQYAEFERIENIFDRCQGDPSNSITYGRLYNWYAAVDARGLCPTGWHVPSDTEWTTLTNFLGGDAVAGGKMKSVGTTFWASPNAEATNESGFSALPAGNRDYPGPFYSIGIYTYWWSSTENGSYAWDRGLPYNYGNVLRFSTTSKNVGYSVRCIRD